MSKENYPVIKIASCFVSTNFKKLKPVKLEWPDDVSKPKLEEVNMGCLSHIFIPGGIFCLGFACGEGTTAMGVLTSLGFILGVLWVPLVTSPRQERIEKRNKIKTDKYEKEFQIRNEKIKSYDRRIELLKEYEEFEKLDNVEFRKEAINFIFRRTNFEIVPFIEDSPTFKNTRGISENLFLPFLKEAFGDNIEIDKSVGGFLPDYIYRDDVRKIYIDIEVDEPYSITTNEPLHYIGLNDDRDEYFRSINWTVIRFSEFQVVEYPDLCISTIISILILMQKGGLRYKNRVPLVSRWTIEESKQLAIDRARSTYLNLS